MGATPDQLQVEIARTRDSLAANVDDLTDRVSPARIARRRTDAIRYRLHRMRAAVVGTVADVKDQLPDVTPSAASARAQGNPLAAAVVAFGAGALAATLLPTSPAEREIAPSVREQAGDIAGTVGSAAQESMQHVREELAPQAEEAVASVKDRASQAASDTTATARDAGARTAGQADDAQRQVRESVRR